MDTFDPKPLLGKRHGEDYDFKPAKGVSQKGKGKLKGSPFKFKACGQSGIEVSELFPHLREHVDEMAVIRSTLASSEDSACLSSANFSRSPGSVGVKARKPWMFSLSGKVSLTTMTLEPSELTSTLGLGRALALSPPPGLKMMFISMFLLSDSASSLSWFLIADWKFCLVR